MILLELFSILALLLATWLGSGQAVQGVLEAGALRGGEPLRSAAEVSSEAQQAFLWFAMGVGALVLGRLLSLRRRGQHLPAPLLLPAAVAAAGLGFVIQLGYGDPLHLSAWPGPAFARGVGYGGLIGGLILAAPWDPARLAERLRHGLLAAMLLSFLALWIWGSGPADTRINLGPIQPIEAVKLAFVAFLAVYLGQRAAKLRYQRARAGLVRLPRPVLLVPALLALVGLFAGLLVVRDLGPSLILSLVFLSLFYLVTRSPGWVVLAVVVVAGMLLVLAIAPDLPGSATVALRLRMWTAPWLNGLPSGDQLAAARWAVAAGGLGGQGLGHSAIGALPAGHTDLVLAHLAEELGLLGGCLYLVLLGTMVLQGLAVAAAGRTPERMLLAAGLSVFLLAQWAVIAGGTAGIIPLTGVVVPFLSYGKSSTAAFIALVALLAKLAENGAVRIPTDELVQLRGGCRHLAAGAAALLLAGLAVAGLQGVVLARSATLHGVVTTLADGTVVHQHDPRLRALARRIPRGEIRDRHGAPLAGTAADGQRTYLLGDGLGTLLGPSSGDVLRPRWCLERAYDNLLRGYGELEDGPAAWMVRDGDGERLLLAVRSRQERPRQRDRARAMADELGLDSEQLRLLPLPAPDLEPVAELLRMRWSRREAALAAMAEDQDSRSLQLSLDAQLQRSVAEILQRAAPRGKAAAAVVLDVDTGQVLARAQAPDYDPGDPAWRQALLARDPVFTGVYGPWSDKTGARGVFQTGSIFKVYTALTAARAGLAVKGERCASRGELRFSCVERDARGPSFTLPHWTKPIHDYHKDRNHGSIELSEALSVSCNVYFAQLGLHLGPEPFREVAAAGLDVGWGGEFQAGAADSRRLASTAFGQGAAAMSVSQAARMVATVGGGGAYRKCPPDMLLHGSCEETVLVKDEAALALILAGMRKVVDEGTARRLRAIEGVRIFGKTGTADAIGLQEEEPYGVDPGSRGEPPHSWFVALAEPGETDPCQVRAPGRLALAVVVPRGGAGAGAAGQAAIEIVGAARAAGWLGGEPPATEAAQDSAP